MADAWGGSWGAAWGLSWTRSAAPQPEVTRNRGGWLSPEQVRDLEAIARRARLARKREWDERRETEAERLRELRRIYDRALGIVNPEPEAAQAVAEAIAPYVRDDRPSGGVPSSRFVDWDALEASRAAVRGLAEALVRLSTERLDDEEEAMLLLLSA